MGEPGERDGAPSAGEPSGPVTDEPARVESEPATAAEAGDPADARSAAALGRYAATMRRRRIIYGVVLGVLVLLIGVGVGVVWSNSEIAHVTSQTVPSGPPSLPVAEAVAPLHQVWRSDDRAAIGQPQWGGTVIGWSGHTVRGIDARTGRQTWAYTRTDRTVCTAAQAGGTTVAVYRNGGNCDEVTALDSATGARRWTRTLDEDGKPISGSPSYEMSPSTFVVYSSSSIYAIDPGSGIDRWTFYHYGCTIEHVVVGSGGALISQNCSAAEKCGEVKLCGRGPQLLLRDAFAGYDDNSKTNPDQIQWNLIGNSDVPVSADQLISAVNTTTHALDTFGAQKGRSRGSVTLRPAPRSLTSSIAALATNDHEVIWIDGIVYAVTVDHSAVDWTARSPSPPTIVSPTNEDTPTFATARISVPSANGIRLLDAGSGRTAQSFSVSAPPSGALVWPLGAGFLVTSRDGSVAYR